MQVHQYCSDCRAALINYLLCTMILCFVVITMEVRQYCSNF